MQLTELAHPTRAPVSPLRPAPSATATPTPPPPGPSNPAGPVASTPHFDQEGLERVSRELVPYIGPMAKVIVRRTAKKATSWKQLYDALASEIPDGPERRKFLSQRLVRG